MSTAPDYTMWDGVNSFTIAQAAALWVGLEPEWVSVADDGCPQIVKSFAREIGEKLQVGDPRDSWHLGYTRSRYVGDDGTEHNYRENRVTRPALLGLANQRNHRPKFLYPEERQAAPEPTEGTQGAPEPAEGTPGARRVLWRSTLYEAWPQIVADHPPKPSGKEVIAWLKAHGPRRVFGCPQPAGPASLCWSDAHRKPHTVTLKTVQNAIKDLTKS